MKSQIPRLAPPQISALPKSDLWAALAVALLSLLTVGGMQWLLGGARLK